MEANLLLNKLERSLQLQQHCLDVIAYEEAKAGLQALVRSRVKQLLLLIFSNIVIGYFIAGHYRNFSFMLTGGMLMLFNIIGMAGTILQMIIIHQQVYWENLPPLQKRTGLLQTALLWQTVLIRFTRIRFFAWPLYSVYLMIGAALIGWNIDSAGWWQLQAGMIILLLPVSIWLYKKVRYANLQIKWVEGLLNQAGRKYLRDVLGFNPSV